MSSADYALLEEFVQDLKRARSYSNEDLKHHPPGNEKDSWQKCSELVERYDKGLCEAYREQIDTLLVFAGLFSAVVTAFTIESYQWLHDDAGDVSAQILAQIANMLAPDGTEQTVPLTLTSALSDATAARINVYWFLSLVLSLSAALVGILAKQWVREYDRDAGRTHSESIGVRQMKFEGLEVWKVPEIVSAMPLLLQLALAFFFVGVLELLWRLNGSVAVPVTAVAALVLVFYIVTTILPTIHFAYCHHAPELQVAQCPYKSPQAWLLLRLALDFIVSPSPDAVLGTLGDHTSRYMQSVQARGVNAVATLRRARSWMAFDIAWTALSDVGATTRAEYRYQALAWLKRTVDHSDLPVWIWHCLWQNTVSTRTFLDPEPCTSPYNILCCLSSSEPIKDTGEALGHYYARPHHARSLLFDYACESSLPLITIVELLCHIVESGDLSRKEADSWVAACIPRIPLPVHSLDEPDATLNLPHDVRTALFLVVHEMAARASSNAAFGEILMWSLRLIRRSMRPSQDRAMLHLAACALARRWLHAYNTHVHSADRIARIGICTRILDASLHSVSITDHSCHRVEQGPPYSRTTLVLGLLAKDIDSFARCFNFRELDEFVLDRLNFAYGLRKDDRKHHVFWNLVDTAIPHPTPVIDQGIATILLDLTADADPESEHPSHARPGSPAASFLGSLERPAPLHDPQASAMPGSGILAVRLPQTPALSSPADHLHSDARDQAPGRGRQGSHHVDHANRPDALADRERTPSADRPPKCDEENRLSARGGDQTHPLSEGQGLGDRGVEPENCTAAG